MTDYVMIKEQAKALLEGTTWNVTALANVSALLYEALNDVNWVGFYLMREGELALGPFQGKPACMHIPVGKGVCGTAVQRDETIRVNDVHEFPGHIACDCASASEIVLPIHVNGRIFGVLDIDSPVVGRFTPEDEEGLGQIALSIELALTSMP